MRLKSLNSKVVQSVDLVSMFRREQEEFKHGFGVGMLFGILGTGTLVALVLKGFEL